MLYRPAAVARHHHDITFASFRRRQEKAGEAAAIFYEKHPELGDFLAVPQARTLPRARRAARSGFCRSGPRSRSGASCPARAGRVDRVLRDDYLRGLEAGTRSARADLFRMTL